MPVPKGTRVGGRQKGVKNKTTLLKEQARTEIIEAASNEGETPLEYMLRVMRTSDDSKRKDAMAIAAAPFVHPKLAAVEHKGDKENPLGFAILTSVPRDEGEDDGLNGHTNGHAHHN
jgi:hypothetical protein